MDDDVTEEDEFAVEAVLDLEDVTIEVEQYNDPLESEGFSFLDSEGPTLSETVEFEKQDDVELTTADAPVLEDRFEVPDSNPLDEVAEPVHTGQGQLIQTDEDEDDVDFTGSVGPSPHSVPDLPVGDEEIPLAPGELTTPDIPEDFDEEEVSVPDLPTDSDDHVPELPKDDAVPDLPEDEVVESAPEQPEPEDVISPEVGVNTRIWPWRLENRWTLEKFIELLLNRLDWFEQDESLKLEHNIDTLGPQLGDDVSLLYHIGLILQQAGRAEHLNWMLEMARRVHPNDENVMNAISHLSA